MEFFLYIDPGKRQYGCKQFSIYLLTTLATLEGLKAKCFCRQENVPVA